jgi:nucleoside-diphosphate-sugar epimerase
VTDGTTHTVQDIFRAIRVAAGLPAPKFFLPLFPLQVTGTLGRRLLKAVRLPIPTSLVLLEKYLEDIAVNGSRIQNETSFKPIYDLERGWRETIRLMRKAGEL